MGFELGHGGDLKERIKELPKRALFVPLLGGVGAVLGGAVAVGLLLNVSAGTSALVAACFGWYSMPSVIIAQTYDLTVGTLALLTNVFREVLAIVLIPWIAKKIRAAAGCGLRWCNLFRCNTAHNLPKHRCADSANCYLFRFGPFRHRSLACPSSN